MTLLYPLFTVACMVLLSCQSQEKHLDNQIEWTTFESIKQTFPVTGNKPLFMYISQSNCNFCDSMETYVLSRPEIAWYMNEHFTVLNINVDEDLPIQLRQSDGSFKDYEYAEFWNLFNIEGLPTYFCFDANGKINGIFHGVQEVLNFKRFLVYVTGENFGRTPWFDFIETEAAQLDTLYGIF